jgi:hypothetical protein
MHPVVRLLLAISPLALCIAVIVLAYRQTNKDDDCKRK